MAHGTTHPGWADVTPKAIFLSRRALMGGALAAGLVGQAVAQVASRYSTDTPPNSLEEISSYNNFYEFGWNKSDPKANAGGLTIDPWTVEIGGLVDRPGSYGLDDVLKSAPAEERIYRFRCVEAWSMVIPWIGFPLSALLDRAGVRPGAKYVAFQTLYRPKEMNNQ